MKRAVKYSEGSNALNKKFALSLYNEPLSFDIFSHPNSLSNSQNLQLFLNRFANNSLQILASKLKFCRLISTDFFM